MDEPLWLLLLLSLSLLLLLLLPLPLSLLLSLLLLPLLLPLLLSPLLPILASADVQAIGIPWAWNAPGCAPGGAYTGTADGPPYPPYVLPPA